MRTTSRLLSDHSFPATTMIKSLTLLAGLLTFGSVLAAEVAAQSTTFLPASASMADRARYLRIAASRGDIDVVRRYLDDRVEIDFADEYGLTALMSAAFEGRAEVVALLLERGADPRLRHSSGETALDYAKSNGHRSVTPVLASAMNVPDPFAPPRAPQASQSPPPAQHTPPPAPQEPASGRKPEARRPGAANQRPARPEVPRPPSPSGPPAGVYQCYDMYVAIGAPTRVSYKEQLVVLDARSYRFRANGPTGRYAYDARTGVVQFQSGPYAGGNPRARYERRRDGRDVITLTYTFERLGTDDDFCIRR
jgi:hypothetical protein